MSALEPIQLRDPERLDLPSASAMEIVVECPGSVNLKRKIPKQDLVEKQDQEEKEWAERGTRIHKAFETGNTLELNAEEHDTYNTGLQYLESIKAKWIQDKALDPAKVVEGPRECRVWLTKPYDFPHLMGSAMTDRHFVYRDEERCCVLVLDLKTGWNPNLPPSAHSWQLAYELITLWTEYDGVTDGRVAYVKPKDKCEHGDFCDYSEMDIKFRYDSIVFHSWQSSQEDAPRHAGTHCRWCPCKAHCPEALAYALLPSTMLKVSSRKVVDEKAAEAIPDDLLRLWEAGSTIRAILDAVTERLKGMPEEELNKLALTLGPGRKLPEWTDTKSAYEFLLNEKLWPEADLWSALEFGLGKLGILATKHMGVGEKYATQEVKSLLGKFLTEKEGSPTIRRLR